ncbi:hypothetical protein F4703DRAFT_1879525 [Phycomyces blakesleeanus]
MNSKLLPNIFSYIATYTSKKDRRSCALVCKEWTEPFLNVYLCRIYVYKESFTTILDTLHIKEIYQKNFNRVWALSIEKPEHDPKKYIPVLQQNFSRIRYLLYNENNERSHIVSETIDWSLWKSLTHLEIRLKSGLFLFEEIFKRLSIFPGLISFVIRPVASYENCGPLFLWTCFELLHQSLPKLEHLELYYALAPVPEYDFEVMKNVIQASNMTKISFNMNYLDTFWIFYFARKYPNLLYFYDIKNCPDQASKDIFYDKQQYQDQLKLLSTVDEFFPLLKKAKTDYTTFNGWPFSIFYQTLHHFGSKLEHIEHTTSRRAYELSYSDDCIKPITNRLKYMTISGDHFPRVRRYQSLSSFYPRLGYLCIKDAFVDFENIFENCHVLRSLRLYKCRVWSFTNEDYTYTPYSQDPPHPLQNLEIISTEVTPNLVKYISFRCQQLKFLFLTNFLYDYRPGKNIAHNMFEMPFTQLETLIVCHKIEGDNIVKFCGIEQMENSDISLLSLYQGNEEESSRSNWYHLCLDKTNRKPRFIQWELGRRDVEFAKRYYCKRLKGKRMKQKIRKDMKIYGSYYDGMGYIARRFWKKDLEHGIFLFRLKSVQRHFLDFKDGALLRKIRRGDVIKEQSYSYWR